MTRERPSPLIMPSMDRRKIAKQHNFAEIQKINIITNMIGVALKNKRNVGFNFNMSVQF